MHNYYSDLGIIFTENHIVIKIPPLIWDKMYNRDHKIRASSNPQRQFSDEEPNETVNRTKHVLEMYFSLKI